MGDRELFFEAIQKAKQNHARECAKCSDLADKVISLRARVAELEGQARSLKKALKETVVGMGRAMSERDKLKDIVIASESAPAASGGGEVEVLRQEDIRERIRRAEARPLDAECKPLVWEVLADARHEITKLMLRVVELQKAASGAAGTEVVAWGVTFSTNHLCFGVYTQRLEAEAVCERINAGTTEYEPCTVVSLYAAPQPASGWLTEEEREMVQSWEQHYRQGSHYAQSPSHNLAFATEMGKRAKVFEGILARSSPPEVALPPAAKGETPLVRDLMWGQAIRAAGVTLKEVGK